MAGGGSCYFSRNTGWDILSQTISVVSQRLSCSTSFCTVHTQWLLGWSPQLFTNWVTLPAYCTMLTRCHCIVRRSLRSSSLLSLWHPTYLHNSWKYFCSCTVFLIMPTTSYMIHSISMASKNPAVHHYHLQILVLQHQLSLRFLNSIL